MNGIYDALSTEDLRPRLEKESRLYCEKEALFSHEYCAKEAPSVVDRVRSLKFEYSNFCLQVLTPRTDEFCQGLGFCKGQVTASETTETAT